MRNKKILVLIIIALIVVLFASILIIKLKQTNKIDMVSEKEIVNEINNTEEEITEENIVVESKIEEQKTQEEADIPEKEKESQQELQKQITIATQDKKVESQKQAEQSKVTQVITKQKTEINEQLKQDIKTETQIQEQTKFETKVEEKQSENYNKMFGAMEKDIRIIILKLADRLHNINTLEHLKRDRQIANAKETMELYAPLANRLGLYSLKWELEDLGFKYLYPDDYKNIIIELEEKKKQKQELLEKTKEKIKQELKRQKITAIVKIETKHFRGRNIYENSCSCRRTEHRA